MAFLRGTYLGDVLVGGDDPLGDHIAGRQGNDTLYGAAGDDQIWGGKGFDTLWGGLGNDYMSGGVGTDSLYGEQGFNTLYGGDGNDDLHTAYEGGYLEGNKGDDTLAFEGSNGLGLCGWGDDTVFVRLDGDASCTVRLGPGEDQVILDQRNVGVSTLHVQDWASGEDAIYLSADDGRGSLATFDTLDQNHNGQLDIGDGESSFGAVWANADANALILRFGASDHVVLYGTQTLDLSEVAI
jgi:Ca2+-binding RTX toxin-like protein